MCLCIAVILTLNTFLKTKNSGTDDDVKARIQKARVAFIMLRKIWRAKQIKLNTKLIDRRHGEVHRRH